MLIECKQCEAVVNPEILNSYVAYDEEVGMPYRFSFLKCPQCSSPLLACEENYGGDEWDSPTRIYPPLDKQVNSSLPVPIRNAYQEAIICLKNKAFTASAIMCRKTLEGICAAHEIKAKNLSLGLKEMKDKGIIENRLYQWADMLRIAGNEAAHGVETIVTSQDAKDIIAFTDALLEYVFTFNDKFNEFMLRRNKVTEKNSK